MYPFPYVFICVKAGFMWSFVLNCVRCALKIDWKERSCSLPLSHTYFVSHKKNDSTSLFVSRRRANEIQTFFSLLMLFQFCALKIYFYSCFIHTLYYPQSQPHQYNHTHTHMAFLYFPIVSFVLNLHLDWMLFIGVNIFAKYFFSWCFCIYWEDNKATAKSKYIFVFVKFTWTIMW